MSLQPIVDIEELRGKVRGVYQQVAENPNGEFHFSLGRPVAVQLGYPEADLDEVPAAAVESFAGVGYHLGLASARPGERVLELGSGSGMDCFLVALVVGEGGSATGIDMTDGQLAKANRLREEGGFANVNFEKGYIEDLHASDASCDLVISNGVINLSARKQQVFDEIARVLRPGGRMAISDIVTEKQLGDEIVCDSSLWAACIGGAAQQDHYRQMIEDAGMTIQEFRDNGRYPFLSKSARMASRQYGVKSVSIMATVNK